MWEDEKMTMEKKWRAYEAEKNKLKMRQIKGDNFDWDAELAKVIERLKL